MTRPAPTVEQAESTPAPGRPEGPDAAAHDTAQGSGGWNPYDVWRNRIFTAQPQGKAPGKS